MFKVKGSVNGFVLRWWSLPRFYHTMESEYNIAKTTNLWTTAEPFQHNLMFIKYVTLAIWLETEHHSGWRTSRNRKVSNTNACLKWQGNALMSRVQRNLSRAGLGWAVTSASMAYYTEVGQHSQH